MEINYKIKVYEALKIYYIGLFYLTNKKYEDVYTIMHHVLEKKKECTSYFVGNKLSANNNSELIAFSLNEQKLENSVEYVISKAFVKLNRDRTANLKVQASNKMDIDTEGKKGNSIFSNTYVYLFV